MYLGQLGFHFLSTPTPPEEPFWLGSQPTPMTGAHRTIHESGRELWRAWARMPEQTPDGWILSATGPWLRPPQQIRQGKDKGEGAKKPGAEEGQAKGEGADWQAKG